MKVKPADLADRYTILKLTLERTDAVIELDMTSYKIACEEECIPAHLIAQLYEVNGKIWDLESDIREGREGKLSMTEIGRRALQIRDWNRHRIAIKNVITQKCGGIPERKFDHASELPLAAPASV